MALTLQAWQWWTLAAAYVLFFVLPAAWMARKAKRDGDSPFLWGLLVLVGSGLGVLEYYEHRAVLRRRARRAEKAKTREADPGAREGER